MYPAETLAIAAMTFFVIPVVGGLLAGVLFQLKADVPAAPRALAAQRLAPRGGEDLARGQALMMEKFEIVGVFIAGLAVLFACIVVAAGLEARDLIHRRLAAGARLRTSSWVPEARPAPVLGRL